MPLTILYITITEDIVIKLNSTINKITLYILILSLLVIAVNKVTLIDNNENAEKINDAIPIIS